MKAEERFTDTVSHYAQYRPHYPKELIPLLRAFDALKDDAVIADLGSGTGILTQDFILNGHTTYAIEPNQSMRDAAEKTLKENKTFFSINATAESTTLPNDSINLITIATAFHWLDPNKTKHECKRILKEGGYVALIWNIRDVYASPLMLDYEKILQQYAVDYQSNASQNYDENIIKTFYEPGSYLIETLPNKQRFNKKGLVGRLLSTSYLPRDDENTLKKLIKEIEAIFDLYQDKGSIEFLYQTKLYLGQLE